MQQYYHLYIRLSRLKTFQELFLKQLRQQASLHSSIGLSSIMSWAMAFTGIPDMIANAILGLTTNKYLI